ncbi:hypothetical protein NC653_041445 [Populus alba x Populus x berolinensis]|uniref:Uncharacterized protein n=1 Tax=Populus alba x Populus x berolinensis TaxID=444605 RepID=A0AAD6L8V5_9ROSI|nr:hypothetical protein NC653_041445 [Populus alba x Populus x berolinensis]
MVLWGEADLVALTVLHLLWLLLLLTVKLLEVADDSWKPSGEKGGWVGLGVSVEKKGRQLLEWKCFTVLVRGKTVRERR